MFIVESMGSSSRSAVEATIFDVGVFIGATYLELAEADADFEARACRIGRTGPRTLSSEVPLTERGTADGWR